MICPHCSASMPDDSVFCPYCGKDPAAPVITPDYIKMRFRAVWHTLSSSPLLLTGTIVTTLLCVLMTLGSAYLYDNYSVFIKDLFGRRSLISELLIHLLLFGTVGTLILNIAGLWFQIAEGRKLLESPVNAKGLQLLRLSQIIGICVMLLQTALELAYMIDIYNTVSLLAGWLYTRAQAAQMRTEIISYCFSSAIGIAVNFWLLRLLTRMCNAATEESVNTKGMRLYGVLLLIGAGLFALITLLALIGKLWVYSIIAAILTLPSLTFGIFMLKARNMFHTLPIYTPVKSAAVPTNTVYSQEPTWKRIAREQEKEEE